MAQINKKTLADIELEYAKWSEFLNFVVGVLAFSLGISCLGTDRPDVTAFLSLLFVFIIMLRGQKYFPKRLAELRRAELTGVDEVAYLGLRKKYFGLRAVLKNFAIYLIGWLFLGGVAAYGRFFPN